MRLRTYNTPFIIALTGILAVSTVPPAGARTKKADRLITQAQAAENKGDIDQALALDEQAVALDPHDPLYQLEVRRVRFAAGEKHVKEGRKLRDEGKLQEALAEFQKAYAIDPASPVAQQEIRRTQATIEREKKKAQQPGGPTAEDVEERKLTPAELAQKAVDKRIDSLEPVPELKPFNSQPINLKMTNKPRVLFETVGKLAGVNVLFDPDYESQNTIRTQTVDLTGATLSQALDDLSLLTKSFWKPVSSNAIFVTLDNTTKRREFEEQVVKVFYLKNVTLTTELQEIITTLRTVTDIQKIYQYTSQNALVVRCEADRMLLAEKVIADLDKPRSEVVVDVIVMEVSSDVVRNLGAQIAPGGINTTIAFNPTRSKILGSTSTTTTSTNNSNLNGGATTTTGTTGTTTSSGTTTTTGTIPLNHVPNISSGDYSITGIPGGFVEALLTNSRTKVLQQPQLRAVDKAKVSLHIGDKVPTASGSFGSGIGGVGVGVSPLVQTQFTYIETGVNMDMTPYIHDANQVSLHVEVDISQVSSYRDVGGIQQPIISQRKLAQDIRTQDGEINLLGGLLQESDSNNKSGLPGISKIPLLNRLFSDEKTEKTHDELLITLIPHVVRSPDITEANLRSVASGNATNVRMLREPSKDELPPAGAQTPAPGAAPVVPAPAPVAPAPAPPVNPAPPPGPVAISFSPPTIETQLTSAVTVTLRAEGATDLNSVVAQLKFDPKILRINNVVAGDLIQRNGPPLSPSQNVMNDSGDANITIARAPNTPGATGAGGLITIVFQAVGRGTTTVTMPQLVLKNTPGQPIAANAPALTVNVK